jgi:hypothetical protein
MSRRRGAKPRGREGAARRLRRLLREQLHVNSQNGGSNDRLPHKKAPRESGRIVRGADWRAWAGANQRATIPSNTTSARLFPDSGTGKGAIIAARQTLTRRSQCRPIIGDPPTLSLDAPKGASVTTASGVFDNFVTATVPEPIHRDDDARWIRRPGLRGLSEEPPAVSIAV